MAQGQINRPMEQNRKSRNKPKHIKSPDYDKAPL